MKTERERERQDKATKDTHNGAGSFSFSFRTGGRACVRARPSAWGRAPFFFGLVCVFLNLLGPATVFAFAFLFACVKTQRLRPNNAPSRCVCDLWLLTPAGGRARLCAWPAVFFRKLDPGFPSPPHLFCFCRPRARHRPPPRPFAPGITPTRREYPFPSLRRGEEQARDRRAGRPDAGRRIFQWPPPPSGPPPSTAAPCPPPSPASRTTRA